MASAPRYILHGFFRSTASYRVRIALNLKQVEYRQSSYSLRDGDQRAPDYLAINPQGLVPALEVDDQILTQSLAICEYLDETLDGPALLPREPLPRARVRAFAQAIACDIHPVQNLKILERLRSLGVGADAVEAWAQSTIVEGLDACERLLPPDRNPFAFGETPGLAEICLVPQLVNARRFHVPLRWPRLLEIEAACLAIDAFRLAAPDRQPDAG